MLTKKENTFLLWLLPIWILLCVGVTLWITLNKSDSHAGERDDKQVEVAAKEKEKPLYVTHPPFGMYIEITDGCGPAVTSTCALVYTAPSTEAAFVHQLRKGVVLKISEVVTNEEGTWYKVTFDEWLRYPERVSTGWYVKETESTRVFITDGTSELTDTTEHNEAKSIIVDRSDQMLYAYEGEELFMKQSISTGILATPTPRGTFTIYRKTPSRYMQGPIPGISTKYYDLPGVPWNLYFTQEGGVIHGAYWHDSFGTPWSNGCVNMPRGQAEKLYHWAEVGTSVLVRD